MNVKRPPSSSSSSCTVATATVVFPMPPGPTTVVRRLAAILFRSSAISASRPISGERTIGWLAHYAVGIAFATLLPAIWGFDWLQDPTLAPALLVGIGTVAAPFLLMQPAMGAGFAASRTPRPAFARLQSVITHTVFGYGLYLAGCVARLLYAF